MKCKYFDICPCSDEEKTTCDDPFPEPSDPICPFSNFGNVSCIPLLIEAYFIRSDKNGR